MGLILGIIQSFLGVVIASSVVILSEIPSKKDILVVLFVAICIIVGVIFKN